MQNSFKIRVPISFKLITVTIGLIVATVFPIVYKSSERFKEISMERESGANLNQAVARATEVEGLFLTYIDKIKVVASLMLKTVKNEEAFVFNCQNLSNYPTIKLSFCEDRDLISVEIFSRLKQDSSKLSQKNIRVFKEDYLKEYKDSLGRELDQSFFSTLRAYQEQYNRFDRESVFAGEVEIRNSTFKGGAPLITIGLPFVTDDLGNISHIAVAEIRLDRLQSVFKKSSDRLVYLIDREGGLLAHPNENFVFNAKSMSESEIVKKALEGKVRNFQLETPFIDPDKQEKTIGAYAATSLGIKVVAQTSWDFIMEAGQAVKRESIYITGQILSVALFLIFLFSITLTGPIEKLVEMALEVARGNFKIQSDVSSNDEVGALASAFDDMVKGLEERDKVKNVLNKFHGSAITEDLLKGELALGGSNKEVTVFFSDIRDFTKFSEGHSPEDVVRMLNEYFKIMVGIINKNKGVVDKFIGDAIMAVWGAPEKTDNDTLNAVKACIEMRQALEELNNLRSSRGEVPIKIGIGIHTGHVISGNIGSDERMEYTVIGDAVNTASRIEASTKAFGTDLLVSGEAAALISEAFMLDEAGQVEVKGKEEPLRLFKVRGYIDENGNAIEVRTEWSDYEQGKDAKVKMVG